MDEPMAISIKYNMDALAEVKAFSEISTLSQLKWLRVVLFLLRTSVCGIPSSASIKFLTLQGKRDNKRTSPKTQSDDPNFCMSVFPFTLPVYSLNMEVTCPD